MATDNRFLVDLSIRHAIRDGIGFVSEPNSIKSSVNYTSDHLEAYRLELTEGRVWPYVLPFPLETDLRRLIWSIFQSKVGMSIFVTINVNGKTYLKNLIAETSYSNKSIIKYLKRMVTAGLLEQGMEQVLVNKRRSWVRWYTLTQLGRWFILFLRPPEEVPPSLAKETAEELFRVYSSSIVKVCDTFGIRIETFHRILTEQYHRSRKP